MSVKSSLLTLMAASVMMDATGMPMPSIRRAPQHKKPLTNKQKKNRTKAKQAKQARKANKR